MVPPGETRPDTQLPARIPELAGLEMILIGGQALAFWAAYYSVPAPPIAITKDVDFVGTRAGVERLARGLAAKAVFRSKQAPATAEAHVERAAV